MLAVNANNQQQLPQFQSSSILELWIFLLLELLFLLLSYFCASRRDLDRKKSQLSMKEILKIKYVLLLLNILLWLIRLLLFQDYFYRHDLY
uniref:Uncharacterized protein n=1 Tax=Arundo donax TaxID=35708 RepID=A0A0A9CZC5_ARUDO